MNPNQDSAADDIVLFLHQNFLYAWLSLVQLEDILEPTLIFKVFSPD